LIDGDIPDISNIHRQVIYTAKETMTKAQILAQFISKLNPEINVRFIPSMLNKDNIASLLQKADIVLDCTDEINTKYLCNDFCHINNIPLVYASIYKLEGYISFFRNLDQDCIHLRDIYPEADNFIPKCSEVGVMNTVVGILGLMQANEVIKYIVGMGKNLFDKLLTYNVLDNAQSIIQLKKNCTKDIKEIYARSNYLAQDCWSSPEITYSKYLEASSEYNLICILEYNEYTALNDNVIHMPLSTFDLKKWLPPNEKPCIFYCKTGKRSSSVVSQLLELKSDQKLYSLKMDIENNSIEHNL
jgi:adenylyltransferase/sulfurtransferase